MENVQDLLNGWGEVKDSPFSGAVPSSVVYEPQGAIEHQAIPGTRIQYVPTPPPQNPIKPHWLRLATIALVVSVPCFFCFAGYVLWLLTAPNRMAGQSNEIAGGVALTALSKPGNITINYAPQCNQGLFGGQACNFPESPAVPASTQSAAIQGREASLQVGRSVDIWSMPPSELTIAQLNEIKAKTTAETAAKHPQWWQQVQVAYAQKRGQ
jgi:hypothetical protein